MEKCLWIRIKTGRSLTNYYHWQNRLCSVYCELKYIWMVRNKNAFPSAPTVLPRLNFTLAFPTPLFSPSPEQCRGNGVLQSVCNSSSLLLLYPYTFLCSSVGSPEAAVLQDKPCAVWVPYGLQFLSGELLLYGLFACHNSFKEYPPAAA